MSPVDIIEFIRLFERTACHMLEALPDEARVTRFIGDAHRV